MSLTRDIDKDISRRSLASSLMQFAREIDCHLNRRGRGNAEELAALSELGVHKAQGLYLHRAKPLEELLALLK